MNKKEKKIRALKLLKKLQDLRKVEYGKRTDEQQAEIRKGLLWECCETRYKRPPYY